MAQAVLWFSWSKPGLFPLGCVHEHVGSRILGRHLGVDEVVRGSLGSIGAGGLLAEVLNHIDRVVMSLHVGGG